MKSKVVFFIFIITLIPLTLVSDTQHRFKVCVYTIPIKPTSIELSEVEKHLQTLVKRELSNLSDVDVVGLSSDWDYLIQFRILEHTHIDGRKTGAVSIASSLSMVVPKSEFKTYSYLGRWKPTGLTTLAVAHYPSDGLPKYASSIARRVNLYLNPIRKVGNK